MTSETSSKDFVDVDLLRNFVDEIAKSKERSTNLNWNENDSVYSVHGLFDGHKSND